MTECDRFEDQVVELLEGSPFARRVELERHLELCVTCRDTLASYRRVEAAYRALPESDVSAATAAGILAAASARGTFRPHASRWLVLAACLAAVLVPLAMLMLRRHVDPEHPPWLRGDQLRTAGALDEARHSYEEALARCSDDAPAGELLLRLARLELEAGDPSRALLRLVQLEARDPSSLRSAEPLRLRLEALVLSGRTEEARAAYELLARDFPAEAAPFNPRSLRTSSELDHLRALGYAGGD
jgi:tetratricopeptide (TPR) repeat protein